MSYKYTSENIAQVLSNARGLYWPTSRITQNPRMTEMTILHMDEIIRQIREENDAISEQLAAARRDIEHFRASCPHVAHDAQTNACLACGTVSLHRRKDSTQ